MESMGEMKGKLRKNLHPGDGKNSSEIETKICFIQISISTMIRDTIFMRYSSHIYDSREWIESLKYPMGCSMT